MSTSNTPNTTVTSLAIRLARANELNLEKIFAKGEEVEDKDILDALFDPLHRSNFHVCKEKGCFVIIENRIDKALETFTPANTPISELTLKTSPAPKSKETLNLTFNDPLDNVPEKWRGYFIDISLVMAFLLIVLYGFTSA